MLIYTKNNPPSIGLIERCIEEIKTNLSMISSNYVEKSVNLYALEVLLEQRKKEIKMTQSD